MNNKKIKLSFPLISKLFAIVLVLNNLALSLDKTKEESTSSYKWVGTWSTAPQLVEPGNNPPSPGLSNNSIRQVVHVSIGGDTLRMRFSNEFSSFPVTMKSVHIALSNGGSAIDTSTDRAILFNGLPEVTISRGAAVMSDPFLFQLEPLSNVAITIYFGSTSSDVTGHPGSRTTSYILTGNNVTKADFSGSVTTDHWYIINTIEVLAPDSAYAVAILGNSITDGRGSGTNKQNRWPDELSRRFQDNSAAKHIAVLNEGIGGNCVLRQCLGPSALSRFKRDVLDQNGIKWVIIFEGINDIGQAGGSQGSAKVAQDLIAAYQQMIDTAHANGLLIFGATLLPFGGSFYDSPDHQTAWQAVNDWIRNSGKFDAVIDLADALKNPQNPSQLLPDADTGDHLHPNELGHHLMAEAVDLSLFLEQLSLGESESSINQPKNFSLSQNFPNPFNPATKISYSLPKTDFVSIKVYNTLGQELAEIVSGEKHAGNYEVDFNAANLPSGIYFYKLIAENFSEIKKMVMMK